MNAVSNRDDSDISFTFPSLVVSRVIEIMQALQVAPEGERKEKLKEKLMQLALEM